MIRRFFLGVVFIGFSILSKAQNHNINELRENYMDALHNYEHAPEVYNRFESIKNPSAQVLAYKGALEAIMTKTTWNVFKKLGYLRKSEESFNEAIRKDPKSVEIRYMRMAVQYEIPEYLGFSEDMDSDQQFIKQNIHQFNPAGFPTSILEEILGFMVKCGRFTSNEIEVFKGILALK